MRSWLITGCSTGFGRRLPYLPLGPAAHWIAERKFAAFRKDIDTWRNISINTNFGGS